MPNDQSFSTFLLGTESLLIRCAEILRERGHDIRGVVSAAEPIRQWADANGVPLLAPGADSVAAMRAASFDYLFSITNLSLIPADVLALPRRGAINFHDGPLPAYAGLHAPAWALMHREHSHGVTWHEMTEEVDAGDILKQHLFALDEEETSLTVNTRCYEAAIASFTELVDELATGRVVRRPQRADPASYFARHRRPPAACTLSWARDAEEIAALVRALDFGAYANPLGTPKVFAGGDVVAATAIRVLDSVSGRAPGTVMEIGDASLTVATGTRDVELSGLSTLDGAALSGAELAARAGARVGDRLPALDAAAARRVGEVNGELCRHEAFWTARLSTLEPAELPQGSGVAGGAPTYAIAEMAVPEAFRDTDLLVSALAAFLARASGKYGFDLAFADPVLAAATEGAAPWFAPRVPLRVELDGGDSWSRARDLLRDELALVRRRRGYARDVVLRHPALRGRDLALPVVIEVVGEGRAPAPAPDAALTLRVSADAARCEWVHRTDLVAEESVAEMQRQLAVFLAALAAEPDTALERLSLLADGERERVLREWNDTERDLPADACIHHLVAAQAARTPDAVALVFEDRELSYAELNARANQLAHHLRGLGVGPDVRVGVCVERSLEMVVAILGVHKAGGAYVPLDPAYPAERIAYMLGDAAAPVLLTQQRLVADLPPHAARVVCMDADWPAVALHPREDPVDGAAPDDLAYVIYTSGSTGNPKGVMVEHRNVVNFFTGMDERIGGDGEPGVWLAVTSLSFDISVLELLWTLARGFKVVVYAGEDTGGDGASAGEMHAGRGIDFSLFYFSSDESEGAGDKYRLLLEGARFGDRNGFAAVWTPERHFHAFGGLYPNPSVTSAAVAAVTERIGVRAGSVVLPLHHPLRVAEEWSVVDNLSAGRVGISFASGWQPNDFVLRPENYAEAKKVMLRDIDTVRRLWRGESLTLAGPMGNDVEVRVLPRPVQAELPFWLTTAGNPESFAMAGTLGANILTHLLGQSVDELADKLALYRRAWREAGHPGEGCVSLMLHTFVGDSDDGVRETVRGPLTEYLRSSIALIKQYAWSFPAFKHRGEGAAELDFSALSAEEMDALLAYSFERYYETSGLFGTPETCARMVDRLKGIGVDDVACLIDFGVPSELALAHLEHLNTVRERCGAPRAPAREDFGIAALMARHAVTHLQCTPSMAGMLLGDERTHDGFRALRRLMVGGEAFPPALAARLRALVPGEVVNMYGPTETTVWSTTHALDGDADRVPIGRPIANTELYVVDRAGQPVPVGAPGELLIGGAGVVRGYLHRPELTAERFVPSPFSDDPAARLYRTGDLVRYRADGVVEFLGRLDHQVKVRGYRIELGEIEALLARHPGVREGVVVAREDVPGDRRLVAYLVACPVSPPAAGELRDFLRTRLPEHMVPSHFVTLAEMPRTPNAKIARGALPSPEQVAPLPAAAYVAPQSETERLIAEIWQDVLRLPQIGAGDNFFDLGGHSLLAAQVHTRLRKATGQALSITDLFRFPTIRALAGHLTRGPVEAPAVRQSVNRGEARRQAMLRRVQPAS